MTRPASAGHPPTTFEHSGIVWMDDEHRMIASVPMNEAQHVGETHIRIRLIKGIHARFLDASPEDLARYSTRAEEGTLNGYIDDEHGHQYGVIIRGAQSVT